MTHDELEDHNRGLRLLRRRLAGGTTVAVVAATAVGAAIATKVIPDFFPEGPRSRRVSDFRTS